MIGWNALELHGIEHVLEGRESEQRLTKSVSSERDRTLAVAQPRTSNDLPVAVTTFMMIWLGLRTRGCAGAYGRLRDK